MIDRRVSTRAFSLVELLTVLAIMTLLMGVLLPVLGKARTTARRTVCQTHLRGIGAAFRMYLDDNRNIMPYAAQVPSMEPDTPSITDVLLPFLKDRQIMCCPGDTQAMCDLADRQQTYFEKEGTSYEYPYVLKGLPVNKSLLGKSLGITHTPILRDFEAFHNKPGQPGSINALFGDGHVGPLEKL
ncbi:MAG: type II secretion system GspH family protein [Phycisphaerae bacterium]|nr:type II secretion system GspH family protein [Phycisphaerae bacterium]